MNSHDDSAADRQPEASDLAAAVDKVEEYLSELDQWFKASRDDLFGILDRPVPVETLNSLVCNIARVIGNRLSSESGPWFRAVDRAFPKLKLVKRLSDIPARACKRIPERPLLTVLRINREAGDDALELCNHCLSLAASDERQITGINWRQYSGIIKRSHQKLFGDPRNTRAYGFRSCDGNQSGSEMLLDYTAVLEIAHFDASWCARYYRSLMDAAYYMKGTLSDKAELLEKLQAHIGHQHLANTHADFLTGFRADVKRRKATARQRARREKLSGGTSIKPILKRSKNASSKKNPRKA